MNEQNMLELKKYLEENGLDTNLILQSSFINEKFDVNNSEYGPNGLFVHFEKDGNILSSRVRDNQSGHASNGPKFRIKKKENEDNFEVEEISESERTVQYSIDFPWDDPYKLYSVTKTIYSLDENGELVDKKIGTIECINKEDAKEENIKIYKSPISELQDDIDKISKENEKQRNMLKVALDFAEEVKNSRVGNMFFGKKLMVLNEAKEDASSQNVDKKEDEKDAKEDAEKDSKKDKLSPYERRFGELKSKYSGLKDHNVELERMLEKSLNFAKEVKKSKVGSLFFRKKLKKLYPTDNGDTEGR